MKKYNIIITGPELADKLKKYFEKKKIKFYRFLKCRGYSCKMSALEFLGDEDKKTLLGFKTSETQSKAISKFIRKYFNYKDNGIMFVLDGDVDMSKNILYVAIVNSGKAELIVDILRQNAFAGSTVLDARGNGVNTEEFFGVEIGSGKEVVLSAVPRDILSAIQNAVKQAFENENSDVLSFVLPISNFDKLHQDKSKKI